jgi:hypothetical protein
MPGSGDRHQFGPGTELLQQPCCRLRVDDEVCSPLNHKGPPLEAAPPVGSASLPLGPGLRLQPDESGGHDQRDRAECG